MPAPTLQQIRTEIDTDPKTLGYAALWAQTNGPEAVAARMNEVGAANPDETIFKSYVDLEDLMAEMVFSEWNGWTAAQKTAIQQWFVTKRVKTGSANMRTTLNSLIPAGTSRSNMVAFASRVCSRAEFLWGENVSVSATQVADAMAL